MIRASFILVLLSVVSFSGSRKGGEIRAFLKLNISKGDSGCRNIFISLSVENCGAESIYVDRLKPAVLKIKKKSNGEYIDYTSHWLYSELQIAEQIEKGKVDNNTNKVYDVLSGQFTDPVTSKFFSETIKAKGMYLKTRTDSMMLKSWTRKQFEGILFLKPKESWESMESINSLPSGEYLISFEFSNSKPDESFHPQELLKKLDLKLPDMIGAYQKWTGGIQSDTLLIEID